jgi:hypothetical protein
MVYGGVDVWCMGGMGVWCMGGMEVWRMGVVEVRVRPSLPCCVRVRVCLAYGCRGGECSVRLNRDAYVCVCLYRVCVNGWGSVRLYPVGYVCVCLYRVYPSVFTPVCVCVLASVGS